MNKNIFLAILAIIFLQQALFSQSLEPSCFQGTVIRHHYYSLSYSEAHEQAEWVYYTLTRAMLRGTATRTDNFKEDPLVASGSAQLLDYKGSGYDRGHLCPAADRRMNGAAMSETFYMSNMSPQHPSFNRGIWRQLEDVVRGWANGYDTIHVVTGGVLLPNLPTIGINGVSIPVFFYKAIYSPYPEGKMIALLLPNEKGTREISDYVISIDSLELLTGIDFFYGLSDDFENNLEKISDGSLWNFTADNFHYASKDNTGKSKTATNIHPCKAITQKGTRCKRGPQENSGYCWQHETKK